MSTLTDEQIDAIADLLLLVSDPQQKTADGGLDRSGKDDPSHSDMEGNRDSITAP